MTAWINTGVIEPDFSDLLPTIDPINPNFLVINFFDILEEYYKQFGKKISFKTLKKRTREFMGIEIHKTLKNNINVFIIDTEEQINYWTSYLCNSNFIVKYAHFICKCKCVANKNQLKQLKPSIPIKFISLLI